MKDLLDLIGNTTLTLKIQALGFQSVVHPLQRI
jgi:hypothetical protein